MSALHRILNRARRDDHGFTLPELLVISLLLPLVIFAVGALYMGTLNTEKTVNSITTTATETQATVTSFVQGVRMASEVDLTSSDKLLVARLATADSTIGWHCVAWYYDSSGTGKIWTRTFPDNTTGIGATVGSLSSSWHLLLSRVSPRTGTSVFSTASNSITVSLNAQTTDQPSLAIQVTAQRMVPPEMETAKCS